MAATINDTLDRFGQGRKSVLDELKKYNLREIAKLDKVLAETPEDKYNMKALCKRNLIMGHRRQLIKLNVLIDVKIKNLKHAQRSN